MTAEVTHTPTIPLDPQLQWLLEHGRQLLRGDSEALRAAAELLPWQRSLLDNQVELRHRSRRRFPNPADWLWTARSLAQSSDWWVRRDQGQHVHRR